MRAARGNAAEADSAPFALDAQVWPCPTVWGPFAARISARILSIQLQSSPERREEFEDSTKSVNAIYHGTEDAFGWL